MLVTPMLFKIVRNSTFAIKKLIKSLIISNKLKPCSSIFYFFKLLEV